MKKDETDSSFKLSGSGFTKLTAFAGKLLRPLFLGVLYCVAAIPSTLLLIIYKKETSKSQKI